MCLRPRIIKNRSLYVDKSSLIPYSLTVPCGHCAECLQQKQNEFFLRSYIHYQETLKNGGFAFFETLTYNNKHLPTFKGVPCFSTTDYRNFMKRLRIKLFRSGYDVKDKLSYFFVSEYGGKTHRPHYHVVFYCCVPDLTPQVLRSYISKSWQKGFIDTFKTVQQRVVNSPAALSYLSKYLTKDQEALKTIYSASHGQLSDNEKKEILPFTRHSKNFGSKLSSFQNYDDLYTSGMCYLPDNKEIKKYIPIPLYNLRKLFYTLKTHDNLLNSKGDNLQTWCLNDAGKNYVLDRINITLDTLKNRYEKILNNSSYYGNIAPLVKLLLKDRSIYDLVIYASYYRGRLNLHNKIEDFYSVKLDDINKYDGRPLETANNLVYIDNNLKYIISENTFPEFNNFDKIIYLFDLCQVNTNEGKQRLFDYKAELESKFKVFT